MKFKQLRKEMVKQGVAAAIIPSGDPHLSEYVAEHWRTRAWISGFTGISDGLPDFGDRTAARGQ